MDDVQKKAIQDNGLSETDFTARLTQYLNKKAGGNYTCSICGYDAMWIVGNPDANTGIPDTKGRIYETIDVACINCGHIDHFLRKAVLESEDW